MPKKCDECRHFRTTTDRGSIGRYRRDVLNDKVPTIELCTASATQLDKAIPTHLGDAREICDKEGDGIFVYFEPITPAAGATFEVPKATAAQA